MSLIPADTVTEADLAAWFNAKKQLDAAKASEMLLRMRIFKFYFPKPVEGTNTVSLPAVDGVPYALKGTYPITRKVDAALLGVLTNDMLEKGVPVDDLIKRTPELVLKQYRELTAEQLVIFDQVLEIKPGSPALEISEVKRPKAS